MTQWTDHVKATQAHHGCSYKDAMKLASATYNPTTGGKLSLNKVIKGAKKAKKVAKKHRHLISEVDHLAGTNIGKTVDKAQELTGGKMKIGRVIRKAKNTARKVKSVARKVENYAPLIEMAAPELAPAIEGVRTAQRLTDKRHGGSFRVHGGCANKMLGWAESSMIHPTHPSFTPKKLKTYAELKHTN